MVARSSFVLQVTAGNTRAFPETVKMETVRSEQAGTVNGVAAGQGCDVRKGFADHSDRQMICTRQFRPQSPQMVIL
jgi:hypothetical protein